MAANLTDWLRTLRGHLSDAVETVSDGDLLRRYAADRDEDAFRALVARHGPMVFGVCRRVCGSNPDAEDAFQAVFVILAVKAAAVAHAGKVGGWLHGVAFHAARKARDRSASRRPMSFDDLPPGAAQPPARPDTSHNPDVGHVREKLDEVLAGLPEKYRAAVVLCDIEQLGRKEAATRLGWTEGTLSGRLARARTLLADRLSRRGVGVGAGVLAAVLSAQPLTASVPANLVASALTVATLVLGGSAVPAGLATITQGVTRAMFPARIKLTAASLIGAGLLATGLGTLIAEPTKRDPVRVAATLNYVLAPTPTPAAGWVEKAVLKHPSAVTAIAYGPDLIASGDHDGNVILWDAATGKEKEKLVDVKQQGAPKDRVLTTDWLAFNTDGTWLYTINMERGAIHACKLDKATRNFPGFGGGGADQPRMLGFSPDGEYFFYARPKDRKEFCIFKNTFPDNMIQGQIDVLLRHENEVMLGVMSADNGSVVTVDDKGGVVGWDVAGRQMRWAVGGTTLDPTALATSPDSKLVAVTAKAYPTLILDITTGKELAKLEGHTGVVNAVAFSPDNKQLATAGEDKTVRVWDVATGKETAVIKGHTDAVKGVAFGPGGKILATASADKTVKIWEFKE